MMGVRQYYTWHMPTAAEVSSGRTIAVQVNYGRIVYVTPIEKAILHTTYILFATLAVAAIATYILSRKG